VPGKASNGALVIIGLVELALGFLRSLTTHSVPVCIVVMNLTIALSCYAEISVASTSLFVGLLILDQSDPHAGFHVSKLSPKTGVVTSLRAVPQAPIPSALSCRNSLGLLKRLSLNKLNS